MGFTLMEVLAALAIFALGMVAAAALFPAALSMQKQTLDTVEATQAKRDARAMILAKGFRENDFPNGTVPANTIQMFNKTGRSGPGFFYDRQLYEGDWTLGNRSYPRSTTDSYDGKADFYWLPFFKDADGKTAFPSGSGSDDKTIYVAILHAQHTKYYPSGVFNDKSILYWYYKPPNNKWGHAAGYLPGMPLMGYAAVTNVSIQKQQDGTYRSYLRITIPSSLKNATGSNGRQYSHATDIFRPGDQFLDNTGAVHVITAVNGDVVTVRERVNLRPRITRIYFGIPYQPDDANPVTGFLRFDSSVIYKQP